MFSNRLAFAALAVACIGAAAGGGYLASRHNATPAVAQGARESIPATPRTSAASAVQETESIIDEAVRTPEAPALAAPATKVTASTAKRTDTSSRPAVPTRPPARVTRSTGAGVTSSDPLPTLDRTWPSGAAVNVPQSQPSVALPPALPAPVEATPPAVKAEDRASQETPRALEPPQKTYEELVVSADSVIGLQSETSVTSERARVEDRVEARVTRDVRVRNMVAIPAGTHALGSVVSVERGGKFKERARLGIRFNTLVMADGTRIQISTETIYRDGDPPGKESAAKMGGATAAGAILGAIFGGAKGAAIGATAGAGAGSAAVVASDRNPATLRAGEPITVRILSPVPVTIEQK